MISPAMVCNLVIFYLKPLFSFCLVNNLVISYLKLVETFSSSSIKSSSSSESTGEMLVPRRVFATVVAFLDLKSWVFYLNRLFDAIDSSLLVGKNRVIISFALSIKLTSSTVITLRLCFMYLFWWSQKSYFRYGSVKPLISGFCRPTKTQRRARM